MLTLQFSGVKKSPYNIAPLRKGSKYEIDKKKLYQPVNTILYHLKPVDTFFIIVG